MHHEGSGAFTGEVSAEMLSGLCEYVILGHSERRQLFGETDESVNLKVRAALLSGLRRNCVRWGNAGAAGKRAMAGGRRGRASAGWSGGHY